MTVFFRGTRNDVVNALGRQYMDDEYQDDVPHRAKTWAAIGEIQGGAWLANVEGFVFEVVEPPMTVEQDVYGCHKGRECTDVSAALRPRLEAMIEARTAEGRGTDSRHFHWFWRLDRRIIAISDVQQLVFETLGSAAVAEAAEALVGNAAAYSPSFSIDLHVSLFPDRMRVRVDDDGGAGRVDHPKPVLLEPSSEGVRRGGLALIDERASSWGVAGCPEWGWSVWADFARRPGDVAYLALNYRVVPAETIPAGAYLYRPEHLAWVPLASVRVSGDKVLPCSMDYYSLPSLTVGESVPIFATEAAMSS